VLVDALTVHDNLENHANKPEAGHHWLRKKQLHRLPNENLLFAKSFGFAFDPYWTRSFLAIGFSRSFPTLASDETTKAHLLVYPAVCNGQHAKP
jgi:hypothetical protein